MRDNILSNGLFILPGVAYFARFEFEFLARVRVRTRVDLLTDTGLEHNLFMQFFGGKLRPLPVSKSTLVYALDHC